MDANNHQLFIKNLHTHSEFCDGKGSIPSFVDFALANNISEIGFTSHAPVKFENNFSIKSESIKPYIEAVKNAATAAAPDLRLWVGLECDYIPTWSYPFESFRAEYDLDYLIGGVHLVENKETRQLWFIDGALQSEYDRGLKTVFEMDIEKGVTAYFHQMMEMIETQRFEILAHLDKIKMHNAGRYFSEEDSWYRKLCLDVVDALRSKEIIVEINTRGIYKKRCPDYYPSRFILENLLEHNIRIAINSDAHQPAELRLLLDEAASYAKSIGFKETWSPKGDGSWKPTGL